MTIIIKADEIKEDTISKTCRALGDEIDIDSNLGHRIKQIANNTNKGVFDVTEAIATHIFYTGTDYSYHGD